MVNSNFQAEISEEWAEVARQRFKGVVPETIEDATERWCVIFAGIPQPDNKLKMTLIFDADVGIWLRFRNYEAVIAFALQCFKDWKTKSYKGDASLTLKEALLDEQQKEQPRPQWMEEFIEAQKQGRVRSYTPEQLRAQPLLTHEELKQRIEEYGIDPNSDAYKLPEIEPGREDYSLHTDGGQNVQAIIDLDFDLVDWYQRKYKLDYNEEMNRVMRAYVNVQLEKETPQDRSNQSQQP